MGKMSVSDLSNGKTIMHEGTPYLVTKYEFVSPGKGQAFARVKLKGIKTGRALDVSFKSTETIEGCDVTYKTHSFLFTDGTSYTFMNPDSFDQIEISGDILGDSAKFLTENMDVPVQFLGDDPISIVLPKRLKFTITDTADAIKGDTKNNATKSAVLDCGVTINVPMFIKQGEEVIINVEDCTYAERANK
jgi:elongation factor P